MTVNIRHGYKRLRGNDAINYARTTGRSYVKKYADPIEGYRARYPLLAAEAVCLEDDQLIFLDVPAVNSPPDTTLGMEGMMKIKLAGKTGKDGRQYDLIKREDEDGIPIYGWESTDAKGIRRGSAFIRSLTKVVLDWNRR